MKKDIRKYDSRYYCRLCGKCHRFTTDAEICFEKCLKQLSKCSFCNKVIDFYTKGIDFDEDYGFENATFFTVSPGYSSSHDGEEFLMLICDDCLDKLESQRKLH